VIGMEGGAKLEPVVLRTAQAFDLTPQLARLLVALHDAEGQALTRDQLAAAIHVGRPGSTPNPQLVRRRIDELRAALGARGAAIWTARGVGYYLAPGQLALPKEPAPLAPVARVAGQGQVVRRIDRTAAQAWPVAAAVASSQSGVPLAQIIARTVPGQKRPQAVTDARALAIALAVVGGAAPRRALARLTGFDLSFIKKTLAAFTTWRDTVPSADALLTGLEARVLEELTAAHERPLAGPARGGRMAA
jgi:hypothetical protein